MYRLNRSSEQTTKWTTCTLFFWLAYPSQPKRFSIWCTNSREIVTRTIDSLSLFLWVVFLLVFGIVYYVCWDLFVVWRFFYCSSHYSFSFPLRLSVYVVLLFMRCVLLGGISSTNSAREEKKKVHSHTNSMNCLASLSHLSFFHYFYR